eukprot:gene375-biopygen322
MDMSAFRSTDWAMTMARVALCSPTSKALAIDCGLSTFSSRGTRKPIPRLTTQKVTTTPAIAAKWAVRISIWAATELRWE